MWSAVVTMSVTRLTPGAPPRRGSVVGVVRAQVETWPWPSDALAADHARGQRTMTTPRVQRDETR
jgi:hypothetical protein